MEVNKDNCCGNVYVNYCCPNGGNGSSGSFLGTNVYVDCRNTSAAPDGSINNPFRTLVEAFDYVDSNDESYVVNIFNVEEYNQISYSFKSKGNLALTGILCPQSYVDYLPLSLRFSDKEAKVVVDGLKADITIYGAYDILLNNLFTGGINLYDTGAFIRMNDCRAQQETFQFQLGYENGNSGTLTNLVINNSSFDFIINRWVYYAWITNSTISEITSRVSDASIQCMGQGCHIGNINNTGSLSTAYFSFRSSIVNNIANYDPEQYNINIGESDIWFDRNFSTENYSPSKPTVLASLKAIDAKLGELQARLDAQ